MFKVTSFRLHTCAAFSIDQQLRGATLTHLSMRRCFKSLMSRKVDYRIRGPIQDYPAEGAGLLHQHRVTSESQLIKANKLQWRNK